jgi:hypothetical protein
VEQVFKRFTAVPQFSELLGDPRVKVKSGGGQSEISAENSAPVKDWTLDVECWMFARQRMMGL